MKKRRIWSVTGIFLILILSLAALSGCGQKESKAPGKQDGKLAKQQISLPELSGEFTPVEYVQSDVESDTVQWICSAYSIYTEDNHKEQGVVGGILLEDQEWNMEKVKNTLSEGWGINGRNDIEKVLTKLLEKGSSEEYRKMTAKWEKEGIFELPEEEGLASLPDDGEYDSFEAAYYAYQAHGEQGLSGWDYTRALQVLGDCYLANYINLEECLNLSLPIAEALQSIYNSWDEVADSYLYGCQFWLNDNIEAEFRRGIYEDLKAQENGPFAVPYDTELTDTWTGGAEKKKEQAEQDNKEGRSILKYDEKSSVKVKAPEGYTETDLSDEEWRHYEKPDQNDQAGVFGIETGYRLLGNYDGCLEKQAESSKKMIEEHYLTSEDYSEVSTSGIQKTTVGELEVTYIFTDYVYMGKYRYREMEAWAEIDENIILSCELTEERTLDQPLEVAEDMAIIEQLFGNVTW